MNWKFWKREKIEKKKIEKFPWASDNCLVRMSCKQACDKLEMDDNKLFELFKAANYKCPDCGSETFYEGPCGGMAQNMKCCVCGHWFNMGLPLFIQRIRMGSNGEFYE